MSLLLRHWFSKAVFRAAEVPDANEPVAALRLYLDGNELLEAGDVEGAVDVCGNDNAGNDHCFYNNH